MTYSEKQQIAVLRTRGLNPWERQFVDKLSRLMKANPEAELSDRQQQKLGQIWLNKGPKRGR